MDERIRAAERSGDRRRLLVELRRAGRKIDYQVGDVIRVLDYPKTTVQDMVIAASIEGKDFEIRELHPLCNWPILVKAYIPKYRLEYRLLLCMREVEPA